MEPISSFLISTIISGITGNRADHFAISTFNRIFDRLKSIKEPINHDIEKSIWKSCLLATSVVCQNINELEKSKVGWKSIFIQNDIIFWTENLKNYCRNEIKDLNSKIIFNENILDNPLFLLDSYKNNQEVANLELANSLSKEFLGFICNKFPGCPEIFETLMIEGWLDKNTKVKQSWHAFVCAFFTEELKVNNRLKNILDGQILAKLTDYNISSQNFHEELTKYSVEASEVLNSIKELLNIYNKKVDDITIQIEYISKIHSEIKTEFDRKFNRENLINKYSGIEISERIKERIAQYQKKEFFGRIDELAKVNNFISDNTSGYVFISSLAGYGKTALLINWLNNVNKKNSNVYICTHIFSQTINRVSDFYTNLLRQLYAYYELKDEIIPNSDSQKRDIIIGLISEFGIKKDEGLIVVIDGIDEADLIFDSPFPGLPDGMFVIVTCRGSKDNLNEYLSSWNYSNSLNLYLGSVNKQTIKEWTEGALDVTKLDIKEYKTFIDVVYEKTNGYPLYLSYLLNDIKNRLTEKENLLKYLNSVPGSFSQYVAYEFNLLAKKDGIKNNKQIQLLFSALTLSSNALSSKDIENITELTIWDLFSLPLELTRWLNITKDLTGESLYIFAHPALSFEFRNILGKQILEANNLIYRYCQQWREFNSKYIYLTYPTLLSEMQKDDELLELLANSKEWYVKKNNCLSDLNYVREDIKLGLSKIRNTNDPINIKYFLKLQTIDKLYKSQSNTKNLTPLEFEFLATFGNESEILSIANAYYLPEQRILYLSAILKGIINKNGDKEFVSNLINNNIIQLNSSEELTIYQIENLLKSIDLLFDEKGASYFVTELVNLVVRIYNASSTTIKFLITAEVLENKKIQKIFDIKQLLEYINHYFHHNYDVLEEQEYLTPLIPYVNPPSHFIELLVNKYSDATSFKSSYLDLLSEYYILRNELLLAHKILALIDKKSFCVIKSITACIQMHYYDLANQLMVESIESFDGVNINSILNSIVSSDNFDDLILVFSNLEFEKNAFYSNYYKFVYKISSSNHFERKNIDSFLQEFKMNNYDEINNNKNVDFIIVEYFKLYLEISLKNLEFVSNISNFVKEIAHFDYNNMSRNHYGLFEIIVEFILKYSTFEKALEYFENSVTNNKIDEIDYRNGLIKIAKVGNYSFVKDYKINTNYLILHSKEVQNIYLPYAGLLCIFLKDNGYNTNNIIDKILTGTKNTPQLENDNLFNLLSLYLVSDNELYVFDKESEYLPFYIDILLKQGKIYTCIEIMKQYTSKNANSSHHWVYDKYIWISLVQLNEFTCIDSNQNYRDVVHNLTIDNLSTYIDNLDSSTEHGKLNKDPYFFVLLILSGENNKLESLILEIFENIYNNETISPNYNIDSIINALLYKGYFDEAESLIQGIGWEHYIGLSERIFDIESKSNFISDLQNKLEKCLKFNNKEILDIIKGMPLGTSTLFIFYLVKNDSTYFSNREKFELFISLLDIFSENVNDKWSELKNTFLSLLSTKQTKVALQKERLIINKLDSPKNIKALTNLLIGDVYFDTRQYHYAKNSYNYGVEFLPNFNLLKFRRGIASYMDGNFFTAISDFEFCFNNDFLSHESKRWLVRSYAKANLPKEGINFITNLITKNHDFEEFCLVWEANFAFLMEDIVLLSSATKKYEDYCNKKLDNLDYYKAELYFYSGLLSLLERNLLLSETFLYKSFEIYKNLGLETERLNISCIIIRFINESKLVTESERTIIDRKLDFIRSSNNFSVLFDYSMFDIVLEKYDKLSGHNFQPNLDPPNNSIVFFNRELNINQLSIFLSILELNSLYYVYCTRQFELHFDKRIYFYYENIYQNKLSFYESSSYYHDLDSSILNEEAVIMLYGTNTRGQRMFSYLKIMLKDFRNLRIDMLSGLNFKPDEYGEVVISGYGNPSTSQQLLMKLKYKMVDITESIVKARPY